MEDAHYRHYLRIFAARHMKSFEAGTQPLYELQPGPQLREHAVAAFFSSSDRWHFLYFFPLPHQHASFLPGAADGASPAVVLKIFNARFSRLTNPPHAACHDRLS
jgi:hypothetical protein